MLLRTSFASCLLTCLVLFSCKPLGRCSSCILQPKPPIASAVDKVVKNQSPKELDREIGHMVRQMIIVGFRDEDFSHTLAQGKIGGYVLFAQDFITKKPRNLYNEKNLKKIVKELRSRHTCFIAVDNEGGEVNRLRSIRNFDKMPSMRDIEKLDASTRSIMLSRYATEMKTIGITMNFAPVVDLGVNKDPDFFMNKSGRIASSDSKRVAEIAMDVINANRNAGIITSLKHFPGHGSARGDTHGGYVDVTSTWSDDELKPFAKIISAKKADTVMIAHIFNKNLDDKYPASLSHKIISELLRGKLGFDGVVITDAIDMKALSANYTLDEIARLSINAGADVIMHANQTTYDRDIADKLYNAIIRGVASGKIPKSRIYESYGRIGKICNRIY